MNKLIGSISSLLLAATLSFGCGAQPKFSAAEEASKQTATGQIFDPSDAASIPRVCGTGTVCFGDESLTFKNEVGNLVATSISAFGSNSFVAYFQTPAGRSTYLKFTIKNGKLVSSAVAGWKPQFCFSHSSNVNACASTEMPGGRIEKNCDSGLNWTGSYSGNTYSSKILCD
ncbi:MAG: hypothetical protein EOP06_00220 [Proteobacteria bacterium]|nr:MAG: hypothetical protein EOP06_00220 [Pseudomonadota bacterium]